MITVIKPGRTRFSTRCETCGCVFAYDLKDMSGGTQIMCPECHEWAPHNNPPSPRKVTWRHT